MHTLTQAAHSCALLSIGRSLRIVCLGAVAQWTRETLDSISSSQLFRSFACLCRCVMSHYSCMCVCVCARVKWGQAISSLSFQSGGYSNEPNEPYPCQVVLHLAWYSLTSQWRNFCLCDYNHGSYTVLCTPISVYGCCSCRMDMGIPQLLKMMTVPVLVCALLLSRVYKNRWLE